MNLKNVHKLKKDYSYLVIHISAISKNKNLYIFTLTVSLSLSKNFGRVPGIFNEVIFGQLADCTNKKSPRV